MILEDKVKVFDKELSYISNLNIRNFTIEVIKILPDYFFSIPASSTGKYHPYYTTGEGGLVRHTKAAVRIAKELFVISPFFTDDEKDCIISALILHDGLKKGLNCETYTVHEHPLLMADYILKSEIPDIIDIKLLYTITNTIRSHMGQWTTNNYSKIVLPSPKTKIERFVHMCDYLASRKCLEFNFGV